MPGRFAQVPPWQSLLVLHFHVTQPVTGELAGGPIELHSNRRRRPARRPGRRIAENHGRGDMFVVLPSSEAV